LLLEPSHLVLNLKLLGAKKRMKLQLAQLVLINKGLEFLPEPARR